MRLPTNDRAIDLASSLRADPHPTPDYRVIRTPRDLSEYLDFSNIDQNFECLTVAEDTESLPGGAPYCMTFSHKPGTGRLIYANDRRMLDEYRGRVLERHHGVHQVFHNYLHDCVPFAALSLPIHKFSDTMVRAYHLCLGGGGDDEDSESKAGRGSLSLKVLAYRLLNMRMTSFKDTVYPHSIPFLADWLTTAAKALTPLPKVKLCTCGHPQVYHAKCGIKRPTHTGGCAAYSCPCTRYKAGPKPPPPDSTDKSLASLYVKSNRLATRLLTETTTNWADSKKDPWKFIRTNWPDDMETLELFAGPIPTPSIAHVDEPTLLRYGCRDADATLRLHLHMRHLRPWIFWP